MLGLHLPRVVFSPGLIIIPHVYNPDSVLSSRVAFDQTESFSISCKASGPSSSFLMFLLLFVQV